MEESLGRSVRLWEEREGEVCKYVTGKVSVVCGT